MSNNTSRHKIWDIITQFDEAGKICEILLKQTPVYDFINVKFLYADILGMQKRHDEARKNLQELLLLPDASKQKAAIILKLSESWATSGEHKKAIATAWTGIPLDGKTTTPETRALLELIISSACIADSPLDLEDARELLPVQKTPE